MLTPVSSEPLYPLSLLLSPVRAPRPPYYTGCSVLKRRHRQEARTLPTLCLDHRCLDPLSLCREGRTGSVRSGHTGSTQRGAGRTPRVGCIHQMPWSQAESLLWTQPRCFEPPSMLPGVPEFSDLFPATLIHSALTSTLSGVMGRQDGGLSEDGGQGGWLTRHCSQRQQIPPSLWVC